MFYELCVECGEALYGNEGLDCLECDEVYCHECETNHLDKHDEEVY